MGFESEGEVRSAVFAPYQVNPELMSLAAPDAVFMHCLPAHRGSKLPPKSSTARNPSSSTNPKTACTCRKPSCILFSDERTSAIASRKFAFVGARHAVPVFES